MKKLRLYILYIIICLTLFFNIERLDFGYENLINIQSEIYILGTLAVVLTFFVPGLKTASVTFLSIFWLAIYLATKLTLTPEHPLIGGIYTYLTITEVVFILLLALLARQVGQILKEYSDATEILLLTGTDKPVPELEEVDDQIQAEVNRTRHFNRSMSLVLVKADPNSTHITLPSLLAEVQASFIQRYLNAKVARVLKKELRRMDILAVDNKTGHLVIVSPETNIEDTANILQRLQAMVAHELGITISLSAASFPDQAYTFEGLMEIAATQLNDVPVMEDVSIPVSIQQI